MDYKDYTDINTKVNEYYFTTSDNVSLKIIDFIPAKDSPEKPLIVFVAGWISHISGWKEVLREITGTYRTLYIETREKTSSKIPDYRRVSFGMKRLTDDLTEFIKINVPAGRKFILSGSSLGAAVILEYLSLNIRNPELTILIGPTPEFVFPKVIGDIIPMLPPYVYTFIKPVIKWYLRNFRVDKKAEAEQVKKYEYTLDCADPYKLKANALAIKNYNVWNKLNSIISRVFIIGAKSDSLHDTDTLIKLKNGIANCRYSELASNRETHSTKAGKLINNYINDNI